MTTCWDIFALNCPNIFPPASCLHYLLNIHKSIFQISRTAFRISGTLNKAFLTPILSLHSTHSTSASNKFLIQSNLYITALYIAVTLYITVTRQLPKIFSCLFCKDQPYIQVTLYITVTGQLPKFFTNLILSAKLTCI